MKLLPSWLSGKPKVKQPAALAGTEVAAIRDTRGFDHGVIIDPKRHQATLLARLDSDFDGESWQQFAASIASDTDLTALARVTGDGATIVSATFTATEKKDRKDQSAFLASRAVQADSLMTSATSNGVGLNPLDKQDVIAFAWHIWADAPAGAQWPPVTDDVAESDRDITLVHGRTETIAATFEADIEDAMELDETLRQIAESAGDVMRYTQILRPAMPELNDPDVAGRTVGLVTIFGETARDVDEETSGLLDAVSAFGRLRMHRMQQRQQVGLIACAGLGALPWQQLALTGKAA